MASNFDCGVSSLLCCEEDDSIWDDNECYISNLVDDEWNWNHHHRDVLLPLPMQMSDECLSLMVKKECEHLPNFDYLKRLSMGDLHLLSTRKEALDWILKVHAHFGFGPLCAYLSINYLDRFMSAYELPKGKAWMMQLLAVACLSLAAKMEETQVPLCLDLQVGECKYVFEARTIQRMELLVLSTLNWRMQAITPFSFIDQFINKIKDEVVVVDTSLLIMKSIQIILSTTRGIDFLEFKPSEIAAAVAIAVLGVVDTDKAISTLIQHVQKERVVKCIEMIYEMPMMMNKEQGNSRNESVSVPQSPIGVLDAATCLSYSYTTSDDYDTTTLVTHPKRRKLS